LTLGVLLLVAGAAIAGDGRKSSDKDAPVRRLDLKAADRVEVDTDEVCLRRRLLKRRRGAEVYYDPPMTYGPSVDPQLPSPGATKPADPPRVPEHVEPPTLPAPSVPMTFPYDGGPVRTLPRTRPTQVPADGPVLGPTPSERMVVAPTPPSGYAAYGEDRRAEKSGTRLLIRRNRK
jgi:hypothetical protein